MLSFYSNVTIDETRMLSLAISLKDPKDTTTLNQIVQEIQSVYPDADYIVPSQDAQSTDKVKVILDKVFYGLISITMFLCFFSLSASMSANLYE